MTAITAAPTTLPMPASAAIPAVSQWPLEDRFLFRPMGSLGELVHRGHNVFPSDIEAVLCTHPSVEEAAVFGVPSEQWGESPVAAVTLRVVGLNGAADLTALALTAWVNERVSKVQRLQQVQLVDALPRNAIGKVDKRALRTGYAAGVAGVVAQAASNAASN